MPRPFNVNEIPSGIASNWNPLTLSPTEMIGFTAPPCVSGVSIAGTEVWNPESLSAPAGSAPAAATDATQAARTNSLFLITLPFVSRFPRRV